MTFGMERMPVELISRSREPWVSPIEAAAAYNGRIKFCTNSLRFTSTTNKQHN